MSRHDSERAALSEDDEDVFPDILYDENKGASVHRTLEWLKKGYTKHGEALQALLLTQDGHCENITAAMNEIGQFIEKESSLTTNIGKRLLDVSINNFTATPMERKHMGNRSCVGASSIQLQQRTYPPQQQEQLRDVLYNFKSEIVRQNEAHTKRFEALEQSLAACREMAAAAATAAATATTAAHTATVNAAAATPQPPAPSSPPPPPVVPVAAMTPVPVVNEQWVTSTVARMTEEAVRSNLSETKLELQRFCAEELTKSSSAYATTNSNNYTELQKHLEHVQAEMTKDYTKRQTQVLKDVDERNAANYKLFDNLLVIRLESIEEKMEATQLQTLGKMEAIAHSFNALAQNNEAQAQEIKLLRQQVDEMRQREKNAPRKLDTEMQSRVELIEQQMRSLREQVDNQNMLLEELHVQASFENSFREVRDWVGDLEKRAVNRGEIIEIVGRLDGEIAGLREEMALTLLRDLRQPK